MPEGRATRPERRGTESALLAPSETPSPSRGPARLRPLRGARPLRWDPGLRRSPGSPLTRASPAHRAWLPVASVLPTAAAGPERGWLAAWPGGRGGQADGGAGLHRRQKAGGGSDAVARRSPA